MDVPTRKNPLGTSTFAGAPARAIRTCLLRDLIALVIVAAGAVLTVTVIGEKHAVCDLSRSVIDMTASDAEESLGSFFGVVQKTLLVTHDLGVSGGLEGDTEELNRLFMPVAQRIDQISSLMVAHPGGREYMLLRQPDHWETRSIAVDRDGTLETRTTWDLEGRPLRTWKQDVGYDPRDRPWHRGALSVEPGVVHWTEPYTFFTTREPGMTASARWETDDGPGVVAFDVLVSDISRFTTQLRVGANGIAFVTTPDDAVLGLPRSERFLTPEGIRAAALSPLPALGHDLLTRLFSEWDREGEGVEEPLRFRDTDRHWWWGGFRSFRLGGDRQLWIGIALPESDLLGSMQAKRHHLLAILGGALLLSVVLGLRIAARVRSEMTDAVGQVRRLGQYRLEEKLGEGGMGAVYRARHAMLRRPTAVKVLRRDQAQDGEAIARFEREVQLTSQLTHPNTIAIYDFGRTPGGEFYYAMEYVEGITLSRLVRGDGAQPAGRVIHLLQQVCGSIAEAHHAGLVHRDVKPDNVMLCQRGGQPDVVKVLDFGLVKHVAPGVGVDVTQVGVISGTPAYMSPEMILEDGVVGPPTDIYAIGAVGYVLLTGTPVFTGTQVNAVLLAHLNEEPETPSSRLGRPVSPDLEALLLQCLAKEPEGRPASAAEVASRLRACVDAAAWTDADARAWWAERGGALRHDVEVECEALQCSEEQLTVDIGTRA